MVKSMAGLIVVDVAGERRRNMSLSIRAAHGEQNSFAKLNTTNRDHKNEDSGKTIFAGNLTQNLGTRSMIEQKRQNAQKQVMKLIGDTWNRDQKTAFNIEEMNQQKADKILEIQEYKSYLNDIDKSKNTLQEEFGIDSESQEQKDLELLEKYQNYKNGSDFPSFSKEEIERLGELQNIPRTEYQNKVLRLNNITGEMRNKISMAEQKIVGLTKSITDAAIEQLKSQDMIKVNDAADEIMGAVDKEIFSILIEEGKKNIDEKMEKEQKKTEEVAEKQEERETQIEEAKEKRKEQEELMKGAMDAEKLDINTTMQKYTSNNMAEVQKKIQRILKKNNLVNEDLKGIEIDFNF